MSLEPQYPLEWPDGWPRTPWDTRVSGSRFQTTFEKARKELIGELSKMKAANPIISSWLPIRRDGMPYADQARRKIEDPGVAVYFTHKSRRMVIARDAFWTVHENLRSIGLVADKAATARSGGDNFRSDWPVALAASPLYTPPKT